MIVAAETEVAEEVRVRGDDHAAVAVTHRRQEAGGRRFNLWTRAQHDRARIVGRHDAGAIEHDVAGQVQQLRRAGPRRRLRGDPVRRFAGALEVERRLVLETQAVRRHDLVEICAVLVFFGLAEHDKPAAARDEPLYRLHLADLQAW